MKNIHVACCSLLYSAIFIAPNIARADQAEDEAAIRKNAADFASAYNNRDAKTVATMWSPDAVYTDPSTGESAVGREEIEKVFSDAFAEMKDVKLEVEVQSVEFVSPNVAIETGKARIISPNAEPEETDYSAVNVRRDGKWMLDRLSEEAHPEPPPSNYENLKPLEWMIGSWIDQDENATIQTDCQWTKNQNFIQRSFAVVIGDKVEMAGLQIVGWDPIAKQIRSWVFDSDGGFAEGTWTRSGDRWQIHQAGVLPNGSKSSAVNIMTPIDGDSFTWQSVNREINGDVMPNVDEVLVVRKSAE